MNRVRLRIHAAKDSMRHQKARETLALREIAVQKLPRNHELSLPLPPSPLGLSNYDALDLEDELYDEQEGGVDRCSTIYSDFNFMNPSDGDAYDYLDALDGLSLDLPDVPPPPPPEEGIVQMLRENDRQDGIFVHLGG